MRQLTKDTSLEEANEILKEGLEKNGFISNLSDTKFYVELTYNLNRYLAYFIGMANLYGKENNI